MKQLLELAGAVLDAYLDSLDSGLDASDLEELLSRHGLIEEVPATTTDVESDWGSDIGIKEGDQVYKPTELGRSALRAMRASKQRADLTLTVQEPEDG